MFTRFGSRTRESASGPSLPRRVPVLGASSVRRIDGVSFGDGFNVPADDLSMADHTSSGTPRIPRSGCHQFRFSPVLPSSSTDLAHFDGTLRFEYDGIYVTCSGDLYLHRWTPGFGSPPPVEPIPSAGIPIFPLSQYRYYVTLVGIGLTPSGVDLELRLHRFYVDEIRWAEADAVVTLTASLNWTTAPPDYPSASDFLSGNVTYPWGEMAGTLTMGWISSAVRRAVVELDSVAGVDVPETNGNTVTWQSVYDDVGWEVTTASGEGSVTAAAGDTWNLSELHQAMLSNRDATDLDSEWRYYVLCVPKISGNPFGILFDYEAADSNKIPREGVGIASHKNFPNQDIYGVFKGKKFGGADGPYFRTAVHEIGHAQGLDHNSTDAGFMNTTQNVAESAGTFPDNIRWSFAPGDRHHLRHLPDIWVRPGGIPWESYAGMVPFPFTVPADEAGTADGLELLVDVHDDSPIPLGAPVRIDLDLVNITDVQPLYGPDKKPRKATLRAPSDLGFKSGHISGVVIDPSGNAREFRPLVRFIEADVNDLRSLKPGQSVSHSLTLLRGRQGALFPFPGLYQVVVEASWEVGGSALSVRGKTTVMVTPTENIEHAQLAQKVLASPDAFLALVIGGNDGKKEHNCLRDGCEIICECAADEVLRRHFLLSKAKIRARRLFNNQGDAFTAMEVAKDVDNLVVSAREIDWVLEQLGDEGEEVTARLQEKRLELEKQKEERRERMKTRRKTELQRRERETKSRSQRQARRAKVARRRESPRSRILTEVEEAGSAGPVEKN